MSFTGHPQRWKAGSGAAGSGGQEGKGTAAGTFGGDAKDLKAGRDAGCHAVQLNASGLWPLKE